MLYYWNDLGWTLRVLRVKNRQKNSRSRMAVPERLKDNLKYSLTYVATYVIIVTVIEKSLITGQDGKGDFYGVYDR